MKIPNILVAEDFGPNQRIITKMLNKYGCIVQIAANGNEVVKLAQTEDFDLIFMDCQMPHMDGFEATTIIRSMPNIKHLVIVAMTGNVLDGDEQKCLAVGMNDYLAKPVKYQALENMLNKWVGKKHAAI